jgi:hypothetical protein
MSALSQDRLEIELSLKPEPLAAIREDETWIHAGAVSISKKFPRFSVGFTHPMVAETHFELQRFTVDAQQGWALILQSGGNPPSYFAGWVPLADELRARLWLDRLNLEIQQRIAPLLKERAGAASARTGPSSSVATLTCHFGNEWAPDDPWGQEVIRVSRDGGVEYRRRSRGEEKQLVTGRVAPARFDALLSALDRTNFPTPPQKFFPPGATVCAVVTEPPERRMSIEFNAGMRLEGYGEILGGLAALCAAFRDSNQHVLTEWRFEPRAVGA